MLELIIGLIILFLLTPDERKRKVKRKEENIKPILFDILDDGEDGIDE